MAAPNDHFGAAPGRTVTRSRRRLTILHSHPRTTGRIEFRAVAQVAEINAVEAVTAENDHIGAGPNGGMILTSARGQHRGHGFPRIVRDIVSSAVAEVIDTVGAAPNQDFGAGINHRVPKTWIGSIHGRHCGPSIGGRIEYAAGLERSAIIAAPHDHLRTGPNAARVRSRCRRIGCARRGPFVGGHVEHSTGIRITAVGFTAPNDHLRARPNRHVIGTRGRSIFPRRGLPRVGAFPSHARSKAGMIAGSAIRAVRLQINASIRLTAIRITRVRTGTCPGRTDGTGF